MECTSNYNKDKDKKPKLSNYSKIDKEELHNIFIGIKNNNELEFNKLYEKYKNLIYRIAFSILKNKEDSEEMVQAVFVKIFKLEKDKLPSQNEASWIYSLTKNETISFLRQRKENLDIENIYEIEDNINQIDESIDKIAFNQLISKLSDIEKEIISLKLLSNLSFSQIAKLLNKPIGTVKWIYYRCLYKLKIILSNLALSIITFIMGIKVTHTKVQRQENEIKEENIKDQNIQEEIKEQLDSNSEDKKMEDQNTNKTFREETNKSEKNEIKQEAVITDKSEVNNNQYISVGLFSISAITLMVAIIFSIFFIKYKPKYNLKSSK